MQHIEIINRIIEVEKQSREASDAAYAKLAELDQALAGQRAEMERDFFARANMRIEDIERVESDYAEKQIQELGAALEKALASSNEIARANKEKWTEQLFNRIIEYPLKD